MLTLICIYCWTSHRLLFAFVFFAKTIPSKSGEAAVIKRPFLSFIVVQTNNPVSSWSYLVFVKRLLWVYFTFNFCVSLGASYHFLPLFFFHRVEILWVLNFGSVISWFSMDIGCLSVLQSSSINTAIDSLAHTRMPNGITGDFNNELLMIDASDSGWYPSQIILSFNAFQMLKPLFISQLLGMLRN